MSGKDSDRRYAGQCGTAGVEMSAGGFLGFAGGAEDERDVWRGGLS